MEPKIKVILCPVDFSNDAFAALDYAADIAEQHHAKLILLHVVDNPLTDFYEPRGTDCYTEREDAIDNSKGLLAEVIRMHASQVPCDIVVKHGDPHNEILELAGGEQADMIVMSTHGWTGPKRRAIGSVAEKVVRAAPCPVLTIRHGAYTG